MSTDLEEVAVRQALRLATDQVEPRADLASRARRGGRRRVRRRWAGAAGLGLALVAALAGTTIALLPAAVAPVTRPPGELLLDRPTSGDLARDRAYRTAVLAADGHAPTAFAALTRLGDPHLAWAGTTPAGPAAAVVQRASQGGAGAAQTRYGVLITFFGTGADGAPELVGEDFADIDQPGTIPSLAFLVGADRSVLVALDVGGPMQYSLARTYSDIRVTRTDWRPLTVTHGAAVQAVPPQVASYPVAVRYTSGGYVGIGNLMLRDRLPTVTHLGWGVTGTDGLPAGPARFTLGGSVDPVSTEAETRLCDSAAREVTAGLDGQAGLGAGMDWYASGRTPSGYTIVACDIEIGLDPVRTVVGVAGPDGLLTAVLGRPVDPAAPLPVAVRLPGDLGWLVAAKGAALRYRVGGSGTWIDAGRDAALLPPGATHVLVGTHEVDI